MNFRFKSGAPIILISLLFLIIYSCKKKDEENFSCTYVLHDSNYKGKIYFNCQQIPYANKKLILNQYIPTVSSTPAHTNHYSVYTDSLGNFDFAYQYPVYDYPCSGVSAPTYVSSFSITVPDDSITIILSQYDNDSLPIILTDSFDFQLSIIDPGNHSSQDTLYFGTDMQNYNWKVGPFNTGILDTLLLSNIGSWSGVQYYNYTKDTLFFGFGFNNFKYKSNVTGAYFTHMMCTQFQSFNISL